MNEFGIPSFIEEPSQSELEEELSIILNEDTPPRKTYRTGADSDVERELDEILNETDDTKKTKDSSRELEDMLDGKLLYLPGPSGSLIQTYF
jgi:hypothetical protein